jgi:hypothetical protein
MKKSILSFVFILSLSLGFSQSQVFEIPEEGIFITDSPSEKGDFVSVFHLSPSQVVFSNSSSSFVVEASEIEKGLKREGEVYSLGSQSIKGPSQILLFNALDENKLLIKVEAIEQLIIISDMEVYSPIKVNFSLFDFQGKQILKRENETNFLIPSPGNYILKIESVSGDWASVKRIMK